MHQEPDDFRSNFLNTRKVHGVFRNFDLLYSRQLQKFVSIVLKMRQGIFQAYRDYIRLFAKQLAGQGFDVSLYQKPSDRKSTRLNSSHVKISYAVFCLKKKTTA